MLNLRNSAVAAALMLGFSVAPATTALSAEDSPILTTATYGAWTVSCRSPEDDAARQCEMKQAIAAPGQNGVVANLALGQLKGEGETRLVIQLPIGVHLPSEVQLKVAGSDPINAEFEACFPNFCLARVSLDAEGLAELQGAEDMQVEFKTLQRKEVKLKVSLNGFSAAYGSLTETKAN